MSYISTAQQRLNFILFNINNLKKKKREKNVIIHGYVVPSRIGTLACTTLQLEFSVYSGKNDVKKYVKNLELINKDKKKKKSC